MSTILLLRRCQVRESSRAPTAIQMPIIQRIDWSYVGFTTFFNSLLVGITGSVILGSSRSDPLLRMFTLYCFLEFFLLLFTLLGVSFLFHCFWLEYRLNIDCARDDIRVGGWSARNTVGGKRVKMWRRRLGGTFLLCDSIGTFSVGVFISYARIAGYQDVTRVRKRMGFTEMIPIPTNRY